jgi:hypothetical protein
LRPERNGGRCAGRRCGIDEHPAANVDVRGKRGCAGEFHAFLWPIAGRGERPVARHDLRLAPRAERDEHVVAVRRQVAVAEQGGGVRARAAAVLAPAAAHLACAAAEVLLQDEVDDAAERVAAVDR